MNRRDEEILKAYRLKAEEKNRQSKNQRTMVNHFVSIPTLAGLPERRVYQNHKSVVCMSGRNIPPPVITDRWWEKPVTHPDKNKVVNRLHNQYTVSSVEKTLVYGNSRSYTNLQRDSSLEKIMSNSDQLQYLKQSGDLINQTEWRCSLRNVTNSY